MRAIWAAGRDCDELAPAAAVAHARAVSDDPAQTPGLTAADRAVVSFIAGLTLRPHATTREDAESLKKRAGLDDAGLLDVVQVTACFAYMNRLADGTGVLTTGTMAVVEAELFSEAEIAAHQAWGAAAGR